MRILAGIDVPFHPFGGSLFVANDWYTHIAGDHEVLFLTLPPVDIKYANWSSIGNVRYLETQKTKGMEHFAEYTAALKKEVEGIVSNFCPDVIHVHHLNFGLSRVFSEIPLAAKKLGICHGTDVQLASKDVFWLENLRYISDHMDGLLFPNTIMHRDFARFHPDNRTPYYIQSYGIPEKVFELKPKRAHSGEFRLLYAGRLLHWKGADIAVEAMKYGGEMHLDVIGDEDEPGYRDHLLRLIETFSLHDAVTLEPQIPREELWKRLDDYDVCVLTSRSLEAISLLALEAQARGVVVVYAAGGGIEDTIKDSGYRLLENTPEELHKACVLLRENSVLYDCYQTRGARNADQYMLSKVAPRIIEISEHIQ